MSNKKPWQKKFKKKKIHFKTFQTLELSNKRRMGSHDNRGSTSLTNKSRKASTMRTPSTSSTEALRTWGKKQSVRHSTNVRFTGPSHAPGSAPLASHSRGSRGLLTAFIYIITRKTIKRLAYHAPTASGFLARFLAVDMGVVEGIV